MSDAGESCVSCDASGGDDGAEVGVGLGAPLQRNPLVTLRKITAGRTARSLLLLVGSAPAPDSGEVIQMPRIVSASGKAALASIKPGTDVVTVYSQQTAINVKIIR
ncbi:MAG: hypothetical protein KIS73_16860 [Enhydrobacter sp.]|nr:hypothetical protein [Enhydrobacter sp.]